ncbi:MAG: ATPase [Clostridiales bacterium]|nr:ATPase [Clostridiales bacterium]
MTIDESLEMMDELLESAKQMPFAGKKVLVDPDKLRAIIDDMRYNMPGEIKRAQALADEKARIISDANKKSENIIKTAEERAKILIANEAITKQAREVANEILTKATNMDKEIRAAMNVKLEKLFDEAESSFTNGLADIRKSRTAIKAIGKKK